MTGLEAARDPRPRVGIVVLNWNGRADTLECLDSLTRLSYPNADLIVVDNASSDGSAEAILAAHPGLTLVQSGENLGFAGGNNRGLARALERGAEYVLVLNNDTVVAADLIENLLAACLSDASIGIACPKIFFHAEPLRIWYAGGRIDADTGISHHVGWRALDDGRFDEQQECEYATGCAMFIRRSVLEALGGFDTDYFYYCEDADLCLRARRAGYRVVYVPKARLWHKGARALDGLWSPTYLYYQFRNRLLLVRKNARPYRWPLKLPATIGFNLMHLGYHAVVRRDWPATAAALAGIMDFWNGRSGRRPEPGAPR